MILFNPFSHRLGLLIPNKNERGGQHDDSSKTNSSVSRKKRGLFLPFASARSSPRSRAKVYVAGVKERERERERERGRSNDATKQSKVFSQWTENSEENEKKCKKCQKSRLKKSKKSFF
jgi:hypothetical protein